LNDLRRWFATRADTQGAPTDTASEGTGEGESPDERTTTAFLDSIHLPRHAGEPEDERVVPPSLAIPFRMAVGPGADYYAPRCLEYERTGRSFPSWNWAPLLAPGVWAVYRRLWGPGIAFTGWPLVALALFRFVDPHLGDSGTVSLAVALLLLWVVPGVVGALVANTLVHHRARQRVRNAESRTSEADKVAQWLSRRAVIAPMSAAVTGGATILLALYVVIPGLQSAYAEQVVRSHITEGLAATQPLQRQLEAWFASRSSSGAPNFDVAQAGPGAAFLEAVDVNLTNGRVRLGLGSSIPELSGRSILLAPALDRRQQIRWVCIPVDIPARYLPQECRQG
jgi:hypothetical protein